MLLLDAVATEVPIPGAKGDILDLVVQYMTHHAGVEPPLIEKPLRSKLMKDVCKVLYIFFLLNMTCLLGSLGCWIY